MLIDLVEAALSADHPRVRRISSELAQQCLESGDEPNAKRLISLARRKSVSLQTSGVPEALPVDGVSRLPLIDEEPWPGKPVILNPDVQGAVARFLEDVQNAKILSERGILTRFGLMLSGPPGTGKTLLAGHIAAQLRRPFFVARLDSLISSRLGETAKNIRQIFDFVPANGAVLFLDELDAIAKMRDDRHELGELKRVVNTVIQGLDSLDDQAVVVAATNHSQLLDPAIWRRFPYQAEIKLPNTSTREALWSHFLYEGTNSAAKRAALLGRLSDGFSGAEIESLSLAARRISVLNNIGLPEPQLMYALAASAPPAIQFPLAEKLTREQKKFALTRLVARDGVTLNELFRALEIPRQTGYRYLKDEPNE